MRKRALLGLLLVGLFAAPALAAMLNLSVMVIPPTIFPTATPWFYGSGNGSGSTLITSFLGQGKQTNIGILFTSSNSTHDYPGVISAGYELQNGIGALPNPNSPSQIAAVKGGIDQMAAAGVTWAYVNEPTVTYNNMNPCCNDPTSIPYNVAASNIIYNYIASKGYNICYGLSINNTVPPAPTVYTQLVQNGMEACFAQAEHFETTQDGTGEWTAFAAAYPNIKTSTLIEGMRSFCAFTGFTPNSTSQNIMAFWDVDNWDLWGYINNEPQYLQAIQDVYSGAQTKAHWCQQTYSFDGTSRSPSDYAPIFAPSAAETIIDGHFQGNTSPWTISSCRYRSFSGPAAAANPGINELNGTYIINAGMTQTNPSAPGWDTRTCNGAMTVTVGAGQMCRDEVSDPIKYYISGTSLHIVSGTFTQAIQLYTGIVNGGVSHGTMITGGSFPGGVGTYTINNSQTVGSSASPASGNAAIGNGTCLVEVQAANNSPVGFGVSSYVPFSVVY